MEEKEQNLWIAAATYIIRLDYGTIIFPEMRMPSR